MYLFSSWSWTNLSIFWFSTWWFRAITVVKDLIRFYKAINPHFDGLFSSKSSSSAGKNNRDPFQMSSSSAVLDTPVADTDLETRFSQGDAKSFLFSKGQTASQSMIIDFIFCTVWLVVVCSSTFVWIFTDVGRLVTSLDQKILSAENEILFTLIQQLGT